MKGMVESSFIGYNLSMEAKSLDYMIAEQIMGWSIIEQEGGKKAWTENGVIIFFASKFKPSRDLASMRTVIHKMRKDGYMLHLIAEPELFKAKFTRWPYGLKTWQEATTMEMAIAKGALSWL